MSAWIVTKGHIDALVQELMVRRIISSREVDTAGTLLWRENYHSVNHCYGKNAQCPEYSFTGVEAPLDPHIMWKQLHCYDYQSCEHDDWKTSRACGLMVKLDEAYRAELGVEEAHGQPWWDDAPWGIENVEDAILRRKPGER